MRSASARRPRGHEHAGERGAGLARVQVGLADAVADGLLEAGVVEVVEEDVGGLAAELEGDALERARDAAAATALPARVEPVNDTMSIVGVRGDGLADLGAGAGDEVEHAGGQADVVDDLGEDVGVERGDLARLQHDGAAGGHARRRPSPRSGAAGSSTA